MSKTSSKIQIDLNNKQAIERPGWDDYFLNIAQAVSLRSHDAQTKVGIVIVDENKRILATGYNGFPPGLEDNNLPNLRPDKYPFMVHGEINAIAACRQDLRSSTLYSTHSPCRDCAKAIITAGVKKVVYLNSYVNDDHDFVEKFLMSCGLAVVHK